MAKKDTTRLGQNLTKAALATGLKLNADLKYGPTELLSAGIMSLASHSKAEMLNFLWLAKEREPPNLKDVTQVINKLPDADKERLRDILFPGALDEAVAAQKTQDRKHKKGSRTRAKDG